MLILKPFKINSNSFWYEIKKIFVFKCLKIFFLKKKVDADHELALLYEENVDIVKKITQEPLNQCKEKILAEVPNFWVTWSFRSFVASVCSSEIKDHISEEKLKRDVIQKFIETDLAEAIHSISFRTRLLGIPVLLIIAGILFAGWKNLNNVQPSASA